MARLVSNKKHDASKNGYGFLRSGARSVPWLLVLALVLAALADCGDSDQPGPQPHTMTRQDVMDGCLASDACGVFRYSYLERCVESRYDGAFKFSQAAIWASVFSCVEQASGDCDAIRRCYGGGQAPPACSDISDGYCDGDVQVTCDVIDAKLYRLDCGLAAQQCSMASLPSGDSVPMCGYGDCDDGAYAPRCKGNLRLVCDSGYVSVQDCSQEGKVCVAGECTDDSQVCASRPLCNGSVLVTCEDGRKVTTDCSTLPGDMVCDDQAGACVSAPSPCQDGTEACNGTVARLCHGGIWMDVDCRALGFAGCTVDGQGVHCTR